MDLSWRMTMYRRSPFLPMSYVLFILVFHTSTTNLFVESYEIAGSRKVPALFVFGDSTVDPGNNDYLLTVFRSNYPPYGRDFKDQKPTGRFTNGKLATDFLASELGLKETIPAYLDPGLNTQDLLTGVSFASAGSGYDNLTAKIAAALPLWKQVEYFKHYRARLGDLVGEKNAANIVNEALFLCSIGTNDFADTNFFVPSRLRTRYRVGQYQDSLLEVGSQFIKDLYSQGARKLALLGLPPVGCLPVERTVQQPQQKGLNKYGCAELLNKVAVSFNEKLKATLAGLEPSLPELKVVYVDIYGIVLDIIYKPAKYGFEVSTRGCCGTGSIEFGPLCNEKTPFTCSDASKYVFWDAIHPSEKTYEIVAKLILQRDLPSLLIWTD
eukprot:Gb_07440 [translate_table: standard]